MMGTVQQRAGVGPRILIRTLRRRQQFPCSAGIFPPFPFDVASKQVQRIRLPGLQEGLRKRAIRRSLTVLLQDSRGIQRRFTLNWGDRFGRVMPRHAQRTATLNTCD